MANDIRDILKGLSPEHRAVYAETRTAMRRAYLYAHSKILPIEQYEEDDDYFLDLIDIKIAQLFDRSGSFNHVDGNLGTVKANAIISDINSKAQQSAATKMLQNDGWSKGK